MTELQHPAPELSARIAAVGDQLAQVRKELEAAIDQMLPSADGLFQPGHTYGLNLARFTCVVVTTAPGATEPVAWGWSTYNTGLAPSVHRGMTRTDYARWIHEGAIDLGTTNTLGEQR
ncbi:MAG: hypothetical protein HOY75_08270 [Streptomyces sp.]|nr:hypothetical protein [Streptomyces sp.]